MTIEQTQKQVIDSLDINKMNNKNYSFNIVDIRKLDLDDVIPYLDDMEKRYIKDMIKQGAYYMLLVVDNDIMFVCETETLHPLDIGSMKDLKKQLNFDGLTRAAMDYVINLLSKYNTFIVNGGVIHLEYGLESNNAIVK